MNMLPNTRQTQQSARIKIIQIHAQHNNPHHEDFFAALEVGQANVDLAVEAARPEDGLVQDVGTVRAGKHDDVVRRREAVHLHQQLVQCVL